MKKLMINLLSVSAILLCANAAYAASMEQNSWSFGAGETLSVNFLTAHEGQGAEYGCNKFEPAEVSFIITYDYPSSITHGITVIADNPDKVKHDKGNKKFTVTNAKTLEMSLPGRGIYEITNTTGRELKGTDCDSGIY